MQEEFRDAMTENAALEGEVSQLTYQVSLNLFKIQCHVTTGIMSLLITVTPLGIWKRVSLYPIIFIIVRKVKRESREVSLEGRGCLLCHRIRYGLC